MSKISQRILEDIENVIREFKNKEKIKFFTANDIRKILRRKRYALATIIRYLQLLQQRGEIDIVYQVRGITVYSTVSKEEIKKKLTPVEKPPTWLVHYSFPEKIGIEKRLEELRRKLENLRKLEGLLWFDGEKLEESVKLAFELLEMKVEQLPKEGANPDFIITYKNGNRIFKFIVEVEGTERQGDFSKFSKAVTYYYKLLGNAKDEKTVVIPLYIVNHQKSIDPIKRSDAFTREVYRAQKDIKEMHLMSSSWLFSQIFKVKTNRINKKEVRKRIIKEKVLVKFEWDHHE